MKICKTVTVEWLKKKNATTGCIKGFEKDFGKSIKTKDLVRALNEKNYPNGQASDYLTQLHCFLFGGALGNYSRLGNCEGCYFSRDGIDKNCVYFSTHQLRSQIYATLRKQGG